MKTIIFKYTPDTGRHNVTEEEFEFEDDVTEEEINNEYADWMISLVSDGCTWYEKED